METDICELQCFRNKSRFYAQMNEVKSRNSDKILSDFETENYTLQYAPVGNYTEEPLIIICGKTTSGGSHDCFIHHLQEGISLHEACFKSIYSKMRDNLFNYLNRIGLFDYLKTKNDYWNQAPYPILWKRLFDDLESSLRSRIQLTQACNCAILNKNSARRSAEPRNKVFKDIQKNVKCFFRQFKFNDNLKLIIFLDTPSGDGRFHQIKLWEKYFKPQYPQIKTISITHPSAQNSLIYNNLGS